MTPTTPFQPRRERTSHSQQPDRDTHHVLEEKVFKGALIRERRRADRSNQSLGLVLVSFDERTAPSAHQGHALLDALMTAKRETDIAGWFEGQRVLGLIVPEIPTPIPGFAEDLNACLRGLLKNRLDSHTIERLSIQFHVHSTPGGGSSKGLPPVDPLLPPREHSTLNAGLKRILDLAGSLALLAFLSPLLVLIAAMVKLKSPGPVFFRQTRVGRGMKPFTMLKFRTMHVNASHAAHYEFVTSFIKSGPQAQQAGNNGMFKIANDPRVTAVGRILRKTSLDELPQLWNVVRGDMSLVGPRPPLQYEVDQYQPWHCRRVLDATPGITGLWQIAGRSRTTFDEMVRLDLRYAKACSLWTDVKILAATPAAVIVGKGAA
jgi:lipopolysaccharide/colanic/teichoic acid biosynthesis glycosyltransferase